MKFYLSFTYILILSCSTLIAQNVTPDWMQDVTQEAGLSSAKGARILLADVNGDNYPDLLWGTGSINKNRYSLYLNVPNPDKNSQTKRVFVDFTEESGINVNRDPEKEGRIADVCTLVDVDNDGDLDLVSTVYYHRWEYFDGVDANGNPKDPGDRGEVYLNDGSGRFTLKADAGLFDLELAEFMAKGLTNCTGQAFLDYDLDGDADLYLAMWFRDYKNNVKMTDVMLENDGTGKFSYIAWNGIQTVTEPMYGVNVTDWNNDGWQDIITSGYCRSGGSLFRNNGDGTFTDVSYNANYSGQLMGGDHGQNLCQWEAQSADFDNDGDMDFLQVQVHGGYDIGEGRTHVTVNEGPEDYILHWDMDLLEREAPTNSHLGDQGGQWFDLDGDGRQDIAIGQMGYATANLQGQERLYICRQNEDNYFEDISKALGIFNMKEAHSMEPADYDLDGDQDLFFSHNIRDTVIKDTVIDGETKKDTIMSSYMQISLLRNDIGNTNNWISVKLTPPTESNGSGIGTRIRVYSGDMAQIGELQAGLGHFSGQQPFIKNFGLGKHNSVDSIEIRWQTPGFPVTKIYNPPINLNIEADQSNYKGYINTWDAEVPLLAFDLSNLDIGTVNTGESEEGSILLINFGDADMNVSDMKIANDAASVFKLITKETNFVLPAGESKEIFVEFTPAERLKYSAELQITSDAANRPEAAADILGQGMEDKPLIALSARNLDFGNVYTDSVKTIELDINNSGEIDLEINSVSFDQNGDVFSVSNPALPFTISSKSSETFGIAFAPNERIEYISTMTIESNAYNKDTSSTVELFGIGDGPTPLITLTPPILIFGTVPVNTLSSKTIGVTNDGNEKLRIDSIVFETGAEAYKVNEELPYYVDAGGSGELNITFAPEEQKSYNSEFTLYSNAYNTPELTVKIRGTGGEPIGVNEQPLAEKMSLQVIPNPVFSEGEILVNLKDELRRKISVKIMDINGSTVRNIFAGSPDTESPVFRFDTDELSSGMYFIIVSDGRESLQTSFVIIK